MKSGFLTPIHSFASTPDIFADKSALVLQWLLLNGIEKDAFSLREAAADSRVSLGLVQRVFEQLVKEGMLVTIGVRTAKRFKMRRPKMLLTDWAEHYNITNKCKIWNYQTALNGQKRSWRV